MIAVVEPAREPRYRHVCADQYRDVVTGETAYRCQYCGRVTPFARCECVYVGGHGYVYRCRECES